MKSLTLLQACWHTFPEWVSCAFYEGVTVEREFRALAEQLPEPTSPGEPPPKRQHFMVSPPPKSRLDIIHAGMAGLLQLMAQNGYANYVYPRPSQV
jgi:hypothetical protein